MRPNPSPLLLLLAAALVVAVSASELLHKSRAPVLDSGASIDGFHGSIREDQKVVHVVPEIRIIDGSGPVCAYELINENESTDASAFTIRVLDEKTGTVELLVADDAKLDCAKHQHSFRIAAKPCETERAASESLPITVTVIDTNNHEPAFTEEWYTVAVDEGRLYDNIIQLTAVDADCSTQFSEICRYEITNNPNDAPFTINQQGIVKNTAVLNYERSRSHILTVQAHDCGMRKSKPVLLTVTVRQACSHEVKGLSDRVDYYPGAGSKWLAPKSSVSLCDDSCDVSRAEVTVKLDAAHIGRGCDREAFGSLKERKSCDINAATVDLLPAMRSAAKLAKHEPLDTNEVLSGQQAADDSESYLFDGERNAILVAPDVADPTTPHRFTLSFWMRHDTPDKQHGHKKENILCTSDDHHMSRHHFSVYIRNCKLEMLLRTEPNDAEVATAADKFRPAEWRWTMPQVCDNSWHHYMISFDHYNVTLHVDGRQFVEREGNPEILDDMPLHKNSQVQPKMVIGACWHARTNKMAQYFGGYLSSMLYLPGQLERPAAMACLHQCKEQLQFNGLTSLVPGEEAVFNSEMSSLTLRANGADDLSALLQKVAYVNQRHFPTPGHRGFQIDGSITCKDKKEPIEFAPFKGYIFVQKSPEPTLVISASSTVKTTAAQVKDGTAMLPDMTIQVTQPDADGIARDTTAKHKLDWCSVHLQPARKIEESEFFSSPAALISQLKLDFEHDKMGIMLKGIESVEGYQSVLTQVHYYNLKPDAYPSRQYTVQCSMLNGRVLSNTLTVAMDIEAAPEALVVPSIPSAVVVERPAEETVVVAAGKLIPHPQATPKQAVHHEESLKSKLAHDLELKHNYRLESVLEMDLPGPKSMLTQEGYTATQGSFAGGVVALIVVICVGMLLVLLVVGVMRMRNPSGSRGGGRRYRKALNKPDLQWDDTAMNITVNPLNEPGEEASPELGVSNEDAFSDDDSSDDNEGFANGADDLSDEDECSDGEAVLPHVSQASRIGSTGLEWDDDTLDAAQHQANCARSYRV